MSPRGANGALGAPVGSDLERYMRALMVASAVEMLPWSARPLAAADLEAILSTSKRALPWSAVSDKSVGIRVVAPSASLVVNSGYPWGSNDAAVSAGRGATLAFGAGVSWRRGPITIVFAPSVVLAQNAKFPLLQHAASRQSPFLDGTLGQFVDRPQRFGDKPYAVLDAGQSEIRGDFLGLSVGVGTRNIGWGTSEQFAPILGANAPGFVHAFAGTSGRGVHLHDVGIVGVRYLTGRLEQSPYSPVTGASIYSSTEAPGTVRLATGLAVSWLPAFATSVELGATRLFVSPFLAGGQKWQTLSKPLNGLFKAGRKPNADVAGDELGDVDNQLGTLYARWHVPNRGAEFSLEWLREDNSFDSRDLIQEPEQNSAVIAGFRVATHRTAKVLGMFTAEIFNGDIAPIGRQRDQGNLYIHAPLRQGFTNRGQLLGAPIGVGAVSGQRLQWERFDSTGSWRVDVDRWNRRFQRVVAIGSLTFDAVERIPNSRETVYNIGLTRISRRRSGPVFTFGLGAGLTDGFNFATRRGNLNLALAVRGW
jgi:hypothetical protein